MTDFVHLHVASSFSMRYGASRPEELVERAAALGQGALALTDRDGVYGAVRFVRACTEAGLDPVLGVDLAVREDERFPGSRGPQLPPSQPPSRPARSEPPPWAQPSWTQRSRSQPVKGGPLVDDRHPRVTVLARGQRGGLPPGTGWARLCRLVTQTHLSGERGEPRTTAELLSRAAAPVDGVAPVVVLLGPDSDVGRAVLARRHGLARELLRSWQERLPADALVVELVCHDGPPDSPASLTHAVRMWDLARDCGVPVVLTAAVRHATPE